MLHCISLAPAPSLYHCTSMALSCVLLPDLSGGRGPLLLDPPQKILARASATFPRMIQSWGLWPLLLALPRMIQSGASSATCPWMIQSRGRWLLLIDLPLDVPVRGLSPPLVLG